MKTTTYTTLIFHNTTVFLFCGSVSFKLEDYLMSAVSDYSYFQSAPVEMHRSVLAEQERTDITGKSSNLITKWKLRVCLSFVTSVLFLCLHVRLKCTETVQWHIMANSKQNTRFKLNIIFLIIWASGCQLLFFQLHNWTIFFFSWCTIVSFQHIWRFEFSSLNTEWSFYNMP